MKLKEIVWEPVAQVVFSDEDLEILKNQSQAHYDHKCKTASQHGGFLYGMINAQSFVDDGGQEYAHPLTWRKIDTLAKINEGRFPPFIKKWSQEKLDTLSRKLAMLLRTMNEQVPDPFVPGK